MNISERGLKLIESFEGFSSTQYNDGTGVMTIGFGTTSADISPLPRFLTREQAEDLLRRKIQNKYAPAVNGLGVPLNPNQFDALCSLAYNCGPGVMGWQIGTDLRHYNYGAAANDFLHYVYAGGRVLQGLVNRREAERTLFLTPPAPTDLLHYSWYPATYFRLGKLLLSERATVMEYDRLFRNKRKNKARLTVLRAHIELLQSRLVSVAKQSGWDKYERRWRWHRLNDRLHGAVKLL